MLLVRANGIKWHSMCICILKMVGAGALEYCGGRGGGVVGGV